MDISAYSDKITRGDVKQYLACVSFMAYWLEKQDGANGKNTAELFDEFKSHVTDEMLGEVGGVG